MYKTKEKLLKAGHLEPSTLASLLVALKPALKSLKKTIECLDGEKNKVHFVFDVKCMLENEAIFEAIENKGYKKKEILENDAILQEICIEFKDALFGDYVCDPFYEVLRSIIETHLVSKEGK